MNHLRINNTPKELIEKIKILAKDRDDTVSDFLRPVIREISEKYDNLEISCSDLLELRLTGTSDVVKNNLKKAAKKIGVTVPQLLRLELFLFIENQSDFNKSLF